MSMKPRLGDSAHRVAPNLVTAANTFDGSEENQTIDPKLVSKQHHETNKKLTPNLVSGPHPER